VCLCRKPQRVERLQRARPGLAEFAGALGEILDPCGP
jgi:hypothetical protein